MNTTNNSKKRRSIRLKGYDYSQSGFYFITICTHKKECLFGNIFNNSVELNDLGKYAHKCWMNIPAHFPNAIVHEHVIMPNHIHGIIELLSPVSETAANSAGVGAENFLPLHRINTNKKHEFQHMIPRSIAAIIKGFKIGVTNFFRYNDGARSHSEGILWQRNYHEYIIRNEAVRKKVKYYIIHNPKNWKTDRFYKTH